MARRQEVTSPKVAIITRTKDRPVFLERAMQSVDTQTYTNYQHVILNDGGDKEVIERLVKKHPSDKRVVIHKDKNIGRTPALNEAIRKSKSEYVTILDDDDSWPSKRLEKTIPYLDKTKEKAMVVKMDVVVEDIRGGKIMKVSQQLHPESGEGEINLFKQCYKNYMSNGIVTYRREVFEELGGYDETLEVAEDWDFGIRLLMKYDVVFLRDEESLCYYHQRPGIGDVQGNAGFAEVGVQEKTINIIRNRYLRRDLEAGRLGVGYIMNSTMQDEAWVTRLEGHVNYATNMLHKQLVGDSHGKRYVKRITDRINRGKNS